MRRWQAPSAERPRKVTVLGATGSIGRSTLALLAERPDRYEVEALTAWRRVDELAAAARAHRAKLAVVGDPECYLELKGALSGSGIEVAAGDEAVIEAASRPAEWVMAAIVGAAGLPATLAAVRRGAMIALANKECLVCAGDLFMREVRAHDAVLLPVDSEHNAIYQALAGSERKDVRRLVLTASGGPFRTWSREQMERVVPEQALRHPNWSMGAKITIDSATMMNKGLELIEAHHLFGIPEAGIEVLIHPQSLVHSLVSFVDGSVLAQLGEPDMRIPIAYTLGWPGRLATTAPVLDLTQRCRLDFEAPDLERFPALGLARLALRLGAGAPTIINAANEVAVAAFLAGRLGFLDIVKVAARVLDRMGSTRCDDLPALMDCDAQARRLAAAMTETIGAPAVA